MIGLALLSCTVPAAEVRTATEQQVRAVFLFQLAQYTTWPAGVFTDTSTPWRFCVLGQDDFVAFIPENFR
jgi:hypothetical protein